MPAWAIQIGIAAGGMALQYLLAPKVKNPPVDKGKFDDIRITGSEYGAFIPRVWGRARIGGNIAVSTGIDHYIIETPSSGGKGGVPQAPATRTHVYKSSIAVLASRRVDRFLRIWADADIIVGASGGGLNTQVYLEAEEATLGGGASSYVDATASAGEAVENIGNGGTVFFPETQGTLPEALQVPIEPGEPTAVTRMSFFYKAIGNQTVVITTNSELGETTQNVVFFDTGDEWSVQTVHVGGHITDLEFANPSADCPNLDKIGVYYYYLNSNFVERSFRMSGIVNTDIIYPIDLDDPSEYYNYHPTKDGATGETVVTTPVPGEEMRLYTGTETQTQDSRIISWLDGRWGAGNGVLRASAMRGLSYAMFQDYTLKQGRVPNFTFEQEYDANTVNDILAELFEDVNIDSGDYDLDATDGLDQYGYLEHTNGSRRALIEPLQRYHQFRLGEIDGKIKTILDNTDSIATIDPDDLRAHLDTEDMPEFDAEVAIKEESLMPRTVRVSVMQPELEYHNESVEAHLFADIKSTESKEFTFPIVDPAARAREKAEILIRKEHAESTAFEFFGMPSLAKFAIGDSITIPLNNVNYKIRIEKKTSTLPIGKVKFQAVLTSALAYIPSPETPPIPNLAPNVREELLSIVPYPRNTVIFVIPSLPIVERDKGKLGVYLAISGRGRGYHENSALYREIGDENYVIQTIIDSSTPLGICDGILDDYSGDINDEDTSAELDIWFFDEIELESATAPDIARYPTVNLLRVGNEWVQFRTATPQTLEDNSPYRSKWRVSNFMRARYSTSTFKTGHAADEYAALVTPALRFYALEQEDIGETINLKAVTGGQALDVAPVASFEFDGPIGVWAVSNYTEDRIFDANATTLDEIADNIGTLVKKDLNL